MVEEQLARLAALERIRLLLERLRVHLVLRYVLELVLELLDAHSLAYGVLELAERVRLHLVGVEDHSQAEQVGTQTLDDARLVARVGGGRLRYEIGDVLLIGEEVVDGGRAAGEPRGHEHERRDNGGQLELVALVSGAAARVAAHASGVVVHGRLDEHVHALLHERDGGGAGADGQLYAQQLLLEQHAVAYRVHDGHGAQPVGDRVVHVEQARAEYLTDGDARLFWMRC